MWLRTNCGAGGVAAAGPAAGAGCAVCLALFDGSAGVFGAGSARARAQTASCD
ncbi:hypothetical protein [Massilia sp. CT11-137]|uniref:hypothetical protein n=1 Tax=Massilia sp. CT11-137 TaxID=3393901 RepID=UPI0039A50301